MPLCSVDPNNRIPRNYRLVKAKNMMSDNCPRHRVYCKFLLIWMNCATNVGQEDKFDFYSYKNKKSGQTWKNSSTYQRLFLLLDIEDEDSAVYYLIQSSTQHANLWNFNRSIRDDGEISIGTSVCILNPKPIKNFLANDVPIIETDHPLVTLMPDAIERLVAFPDSLRANVTRGFRVQGATLELYTFACVPGMCSGYFCDRQRVKELNTIKKGCGCYQTGRNSSIVLKFDMQASYNEKCLDITDFSSVKFQEIFISGAIPVSCGVETFGVTTENYNELFDCVEEIIDFVNDNGGWTLLGWSKRGHINDDSAESSDREKIESAEVTHHVVRIYPTKNHSLEGEYEKARYNLNFLLGL